MLKSRIPFLVIWPSTLCIVLDQISKAWAVWALKGREANSYLANTFRLEYSENPGAFLSLGAQLSPDVRFWLMSVAVGIFLLLLGGYLFLHKELPKPERIALSFVWSGGLSNLIDRLFRESGRVVDFLNVGISSLRTGIFNVADMAILFGIFAYIYFDWKSQALTSKLHQT